MSKDNSTETGIVPIGINGLQKIANSLKITDKLIGTGKTESVIIGAQEWMLKNLDVSHFRNGDLISEIQDFDEWTKADKDGIPAWCYFNNDIAHGEKFGKLYNRHVVTDAREISPMGWHIPSLEELRELTDFLGGFEIAGLKMKKNTIQPKIPYPILQGFKPNPKAKSPSLAYRLFRARFELDGELDEINNYKESTNESGFSALLCGCREDWPYVSGYVGMNVRATFWLSSLQESTWLSSLTPMGFRVNCASDEVLLNSQLRSAEYTVRNRKFSEQSAGFSIRCIKSASN